MTRVQRSDIINKIFTERATAMAVISLCKVNTTVTVTMHDEDTIWYSAPGLHCRTLISA